MIDSQLKIVVIKNASSQVPIPQCKNLNGTSYLPMEYDRNEDELTVYMTMQVLTVKIWTGVTKKCSLPEHLYIKYFM